MLTLSVNGSVCSLLLTQRFTIPVTEICAECYRGKERLAVVIQSLSHVQLCVTPWTVALQAFPSFTISRSLHKLMSIDSMIPSNHLILCHLLLLLLSIFLSIRIFSMSQLFASCGQNIGASVSTLVLLMSVQG